jgi:predicted ester cyclase
MALFSLTAGIRFAAFGTRVNLRLIIPCTISSDCYNSYTYCIFAVYSLAQQNMREAVLFPNNTRADGVGWRKTDFGARMQSSDIQQIQLTWTCAESAYSKEDIQMSEELKAKIRWAGEEAWMKGNLDAFDEVYAAHFVWHRPPFPKTSGLEAVKESVGGLRSAYSNILIAYEEMINEGNSIAYRYSWQAKHTGQSPTFPIPPTGKEVTLRGCVVAHIMGGKVVEEFEYSDYLGFLQQLGVVPPLG